MLHWVFKLIWMCEIVAANIYKSYKNMFSMFIYLKWQELYRFVLLCLLGRGRFLLGGLGTYLACSCCCLQCGVFNADRKWLGAFDWLPSFQFIWAFWWRLECAGCGWPESTAERVTGRCVCSPLNSQPLYHHFLCHWTWPFHLIFSQPACLRSLPAFVSLFLLLWLDSTCPHICSFSLGSNTFPLACISLTVC